MVNVIGEDKNQFKQATCSNCGAILQYSKMEVKQEKRYDYTGDFDVVNVIACPRCGEDVRVK